MSDSELLLSEEDLVSSREKFVPKSGLDFGRFLRVITRNLYWIILLAIFGLASAFFWLKYQVPSYQIESTIGFTNNDRTTAANQVLLSAGITVDAPSILLQNDILILKSYDIIDAVVDSLDLDFQMNSEGRVRRLPLHKTEFPARMKLGRNAQGQTRGEFRIEYRGGAANFTYKKTNKVTAVPYGQPTVLPTGDTMFIPQAPAPGYFRKRFSLIITPREATVARYTNMLTIVPVPKATGILRMSMTTPVPETAVEFMKVLLHYFRKANLAFKNEATVQAKAFIDGRIDSMGRELDAAESRITNFQVQNRVLEPNSLAGYDLGQLNNLDIQRSQAMLQSELVNELERQIGRANYGNDIVANPFGVSDPILSGLIGQYNAQVLSKRKIRETGTPEDPTLPVINAQIDELRSAILKNVVNIRQQARIQVNNNVQQEQEFTRRFSALPPKQQQLADLRRQKEIKEGLYERMLQKREDFALQLASGAPEARIVSEPRNAGQVSPNQIIAYSVGGGLGFGLPIIGLLLSVLLNRRLETRKEVELLSDLPIVGEINNAAPGKQAIQVRPGNRDLLAEQYRALRSNLMFMGLEDRGKQAGGKTILITSYMRDEGKSFTTLNLASILAQTGKRTVVLEFDLRKPKISAKLHKKQPTGISQYLVNPQMQLADITVLAEDSIPSLFLIGTGPLAPNPAELLHHPRMEEMFAQLRRDYDYIVIDSAPVGLVSDTLALAPYADITLYILRHKYSEKGTISQSDRLVFEGKIKNVGLVINGIKAGGFNQSYYYYYGGKYQYGYN